MKLEIEFLNMKLKIEFLEINALMDLLAPHTSGPRDVSSCEALSLLQKPLNYRGGSSKTMLR
jgi:hypothetical protein